MEVQAAGPGREDIRNSHIAWVSRGDLSGLAVGNGCKGSRTPSCSNRGSAAFHSKGHCHPIPLRVGLEIPLHSDACCLLFSYKGQLKAGPPACILTINPLPAGI